MSEILTDFSVAALLAANEANLAAWVTDFGRGPAGTVEVGADVTLYTSDIRLPLCNGVLRAHFRARNADARITQALAHFERNQIGLFWWLSPSDQPADLGKRLKAHGLWHKTGEDDATGMWLDLRSLNTPVPLLAGGRIEPVTGQASLQAWIDVMVAANSYPAFVRTDTAFYRHCARQALAPGTACRYFVGWLDNQPVATSLLLMQSGVAGLYFVSTVRQARRRGIGTAMTLTALHAARSLGYLVAVLQASPMGLPIYQRLGFQAQGQFGLYIQWGKD